MDEGADHGGGMFLGLFCRPLEDALETALQRCRRVVVKQREGLEQVSRVWSSRVPRTAKAAEKLLGRSRSNHR